ncbi:MAG: porin [Bdellovibrionales bacterium]
MKFYLFFSVFLTIAPLFSQANTADVTELTSAPPKITTDKGLMIESPNNAFSMRIGLRTQTRLSVEDYDENSSSKDLTDIQVRRMRLRFDGHAYAKNLRYNLQFAFTRGDQDWDTIDYPNILRDASITWEWADNQVLIFGLRKLPGNRQRLVSSGAQEFVDRSLANAIFNIDRDNGVQSRHQWGSESPFRLQLALSSGEGRGQPNKGTGLSTTARVEWLPLGLFQEDGDFFEGDLLFESDHKLAFGLSHNKNRKAYRLGGQIGEIMDNDSRRDLESLMADVLWKYQGYSISLEQFMRNAEDPTISADQTIYEGTGTNIQFSYVFPNKVSPAVRWTHIKPKSELKNFLNERTQVTVGLSKYINRHKFKVQGDYTVETIEPRQTTGRLQNNIFRLQLEFGI